MTGVESRIRALPPEMPGPLAERSARGVVTGVLSELSSPEQLARLDSLVTTASTAVFRGLAIGLRGGDGAVLQQVATRAASASVDRLAYDLEHDPSLLRWLATMTRELSASAVVGAREELSLFPTCGEADRAACIERHIAALSRAAARGAVAGLFDAARVPLVALAFLAGILITFVSMRARGRRDLDRRPAGA